jgi:hypothetical protein
MSNSGFNPSLSNSSITSKKQGATNTVPMYMGGSQVKIALGYTPVIPKIETKPITFKK